MSNAERRALLNRVLVEMGEARAELRLIRVGLRRELIAEHWRKSAISALYWAHMTTFAGAMRSGRYE